MRSFAHDTKMTLAAPHKNRTYFSVYLLHDLAESMLVVKHFEAGALHSMWEDCEMANVIC